MQGVLCFAGLRGAIAFALSENMPGPNKDVYATATLSICIFTTIVCGGLTDKVLTLTDMKLIDDADVDTDNEEAESLANASSRYQMHGRVYAGVKGVWKDFDNRYLKVLFGGSRTVRSGANRHNFDDHGHYEMPKTQSDSLDEDE